MPSARKPWWQQATALVSLSTGGAITGFSFAPQAPADVTSPAGMPIELLALKHTARPAPTADAMLRSAIVNVANYYLRIAEGKSPAEMEAIIWQHDSIDGVDHGASCAAFASLTLELAAQVVGQQSWVTGGISYPWPLHEWADARVDPNPQSPGIISIRQDAQAHHRWHPLGDGYTPQPGDWVLFDGHVEVVTKYADGVLQAIGGDSLPNFSVNAHEYPDPLDAQGVAGFVNNGATPDAAKPPGAANNASDGQQAQDGANPLGSVDIPGTSAADGQRPALARTPGNADIPGIAGLAPGSGKDRQAPRPAQRGQESPRAGSQPPGRAGSGNVGDADLPGVGPVQSAATPGPETPGIAAIPGLAATSPPHHTGSPAAPTAAYRGHQPAPAGMPGNATATQQAFIRAVAPGAIAAQHRYGVPAAVTIAQAIEESGWGQSQLATKDHNLFGIKGSGPAGSEPQPTQEYENGQLVTRISSFRVYHNIAESIDDHGRLLAFSDHYKQAMAVRQVPNAFAATLTGVYATDPDYGAKLIKLMRLHNLYQYDVAAPDRAQAAAPSPAQAAAPGPAQAAAPGPAQAATPGEAAIPGLAGIGLAPRAGTPAPPSSPSGNPEPGAQAGAFRRLPPAHDMPAKRTPSPVNCYPQRVASRAACITTEQYRQPIPMSVQNAFTITAKMPLMRAEPLYRDVASHSGLRWELLAACDWMQCEARPRYSPVHGERLGTVNPDGTVYRTKSAALARCADDLVELALTVYQIDLIATGVLSVRDLASAFAAFRWGGLLKLHHTSAMEFPYSVAGLTAQHINMRWPKIAEPNTPDKPGARFHMPFGAVPIVLGLKYPATV